MRFYCLRNFVLSKPLRKVTYKTTKIHILEMNNKAAHYNHFFTFTMLENDSKTENNSPEKSFLSNKLQYLCFNVCHGTIC